MSLRDRANKLLFALSLLFLAAIVQRGNFISSVPLGDLAIIVSIVSAFFLPLPYGATVAVWAGVALLWSPGSLVSSLAVVILSLLGFFCMRYLSWRPLVVALSFILLSLVLFYFIFDRSAITEVPYYFLAVMAWDLLLGSIVYVAFAARYSTVAHSARTASTFGIR